MEMKSNDGPAEELLNVELDRTSEEGGLAVRRMSWMALAFSCSSLMESAVGDDNDDEPAECTFVAAWRRPRLFVVARLQTSDGRSSMSPRMVMED